MNNHCIGYSFVKPLNITEFVTLGQIYGYYFEQKHFLLKMKNRMKKKGFERLN